MSSNLSLKFKKDLIPLFFLLFKRLKILQNERKKHYYDVLNSNTYKDLYGCNLRLYTIIKNIKLSRYLFFTVYFDHFIYKFRDHTHFT